MQPLKGESAWCKQCVALVQRFGNYQDKYATMADVFEQKPQITTALSSKVVQEELVREFAQLRRKISYCHSVLIIFTVESKPLP